MKGTEAWEQHGEPSREEAWYGNRHSYTSLKLGYLLEAGKEESQGMGRGAVLVD